MVRIGICDDESIILEMLNVLIQECLIELEVDGEIVLFDSGEKVLEQAETIDYLFLDIEMPDMDGIEVGHRLNARNIDCKIVMATSRVDRFREAFKISAFDFVSKPFNKEEIKEVLRRGLDEYQDMKTIDVFMSRNKHEIYVKDIKFIEAIDSSVELVSSHGVYRKETSLSKLEEILDERFFFRISKKYIVNIRWIDEYKDGMVKIDNVVVKVSVRKKKEFERRYIEYDVNFR